MMNFEENFLPSKPYFPYFNTDQMIWGLRKFCLREIFLFCGARYRTESWWSVVSTWSSILVAHPVDKVSRESPEIWSFHFCIVFFSPLSHQVTSQLTDVAAEQHWSHDIKKTQNKYHYTLQNLDRGMRYTICVWAHWKDPEEQNGIQIIFNKQRYFYLQWNPQ